MAKWIALLRGINVGGRNKVPMAELRALGETLGWRNVATFIQSGNIVFEAEGDGTEIEARLEAAIDDRFSIRTTVMARSAADFARLLEANPFAAEAEADPAKVMVAVSKRPLAHGAPEAIQAKASAGERVRKAGGALWFHYPEGAGRSKLTPALIDRAAGSPVTARNWRTALALRDMAR